MAVATVVVAGAVWAVVGLLPGHGAGPTAGRTAGRTGGAAAGARRRGEHPETTTAAPATTTTSAPATTTTVDPGTLPQTGQFPTATSPQFQAAMADLWQGVVTGSVTPAMPAFFPETAYVQLKAIGNPQADWHDRLVAEYAQDIAAAHALLGSDPAAARLVAVNVPSQYGHWITPGVCTNGLGYFELPNARVVYQQGGQERSFGIASMISWRGEWYVVHLGAILRSGTGGEVDAPATGPGTSAPSSTC